MHMLHLISWVLNIFGIFFILAAHEHYSIDVFISFYLSSRLFMYYHTLANNRSLMQQDAERTRIWFPMFAFFESKCDGIVPNEFEWPLPAPDSIVQYFQDKLKMSWFFVYIVYVMVLWLMSIHAWSHYPLLPTLCSTCTFRANLKARVCLHCLSTHVSCGGIMPREAPEDLVLCYLSHMFFGW